MTGKSSLQRVQTPTGGIHVLRLYCIVEGKQLSRELFGMFWLDTSLRSIFEEPLNTTVPEGLDHPI